VKKLIDKLLTISVNFTATNGKNNLPLTVFHDSAVVIFFTNFNFFIG
jgi:hypothetical protein